MKIEHPAPAFCEKILCIYRESELGWWINDLKLPEYDIFAEDIRVMPVKLDPYDIKKSIRETVKKGYRPYVFVKYPIDWPQVFDAFGFYQSITRLLIFGRDEFLMSALLHTPSREIYGAFYGMESIMVPNINYGAALDSKLPVKFGDFIALKERHYHTLKSENDLLLLAKSRLNPLRYIAISRTIDVAALYQIYIDHSGNISHCSAPIHSAGKEIKFEFDWQLSLNSLMLNSIKSADSLQEIANWLGTLSKKQIDIECINELCDAEIIELTGKFTSILTWWSNNLFSLNFSNALNKIDILRQSLSGIIEMVEFYNLEDVLRGDLSPPLDDSASTVNLEDLERVAKEYRDRKI